VPCLFVELCALFSVNVCPNFLDEGSLCCAVHGCHCSCVDVYDRGTSNILIANLFAPNPRRQSTGVLSHFGRVQDPTFPLYSSTKRMHANILSLASNGRNLSRNQILV
jgi:hypothetical protein